LPDAISTLRVPSLYNPGGVLAAVVLKPTAMWYSERLETAGSVAVGVVALVNVPQLMVPPTALRMSEKEARPFWPQPPAEPFRLKPVLIQMSTAVVPVEFRESAHVLTPSPFVSM
jgi:hypothetical protein